MNQSIHVACPTCRAETTRLKFAKIMDRLWFLGVGYGLRVERALACPRCMRRRLWRRTWANLLTANLMWPLVVVPMHMFYALATLLPGHARVVRRQLAAHDAAR